MEIADSSDSEPESEKYVDTIFIIPPIEGSGPNYQKENKPAEKSAAEEKKDSVICPIEGSGSNNQKENEPAKKSAAEEKKDSVICSIERSGADDQKEIKPAKKSNAELKRAYRPRKKKPFVWEGEWTEEMLEKFVSALLPRRKQFKFQRGSPDQPRVFTHQKDLFERLAKKLNLTLPQFEQKLTEFNALYYKHLHEHIKSSPIADVSVWARTLPQWLRLCATRLLRNGFNLVMYRQRLLARARSRALSSRDVVLSALVQSMFGECVARRDACVSPACRQRAARSVYARVLPRHVDTLWNAILATTLCKLSYLLCGTPYENRLDLHERRVADVLILSTSHDAAIEPRMLDPRAGKQLSLLARLVHKYRVEDQNTPLRKWKELLNEYAASPHAGYASCVLLQRRWCSLRQAAANQLSTTTHRQLIRDVNNRFPHLRSRAAPTWWEMLEDYKVLILDPKDDGLYKTETKVDTQADEDDDLILVEKAVETVDVDDKSDDDDQVTHGTHRHMTIVKNEIIDTNDGKSSEDKIPDSDITPNDSHPTLNRSANVIMYVRRTAENHIILSNNAVKNVLDNSAENGNKEIQTSIPSSSTLVNTNIPQHNTENIDKSVERNETYHNALNNTETATTNNDSTSKADTETSDIMEILRNVDPLQVQTSIIFDSDSDSEHDNLVIDTMPQRNEQEGPYFSNDASQVSESELRANISELVDKISPVEQDSMPVEMDISEDTNTAQNRENITSESNRLADTYEESVDTNVESVDTNVESVDTNVESVDTNEKSVDTNVESVDTNEKSVDTNEKSVDTNVESVDTNEKSVDTNEKSVDTNVESVDTNEKSVDTNDKSVDTNEKSVDTNVESVDTNEKSVDTNVESVDTNEKSVDTNEKSVDTNEKSVDTNEKSVDTNEKSVDTNEKSVDTNEKSVETSVESVDTNVESVDTNVESVHTNVESVDTNVESTSKTCEEVNNTSTKDGEEVNNTSTKDGEDAEMHEPNMDKETQEIDTNDNNILANNSTSKKQSELTPSRENEECSDNSVNGNSENNEMEHGDSNSEMQDKSNVNVGKSCEQVQNIIVGAFDDDDSCSSLIDTKLTMKAFVPLQRVDSIWRQHDNNTQQFDNNPQHSDNNKQHSNNLSDTKKMDEVLSAICKPVYVVLKRDRYIDELTRERARQRVCKRVELPSIEEVRRINRNILTAQVKPLSCRKPSEQEETVSEDTADPEPTLPSTVAQSQSDTLDLEAAAEAIRSADTNLQTLLEQILTEFVDENARNYKNPVTRKRKNDRPRSVTPELALPDDHDEWIRQKNISKRYFSFGQTEPQTLNTDDTATPTNSETENANSRSHSNFKIFVQTPEQINERTQVEKEPAEAQIHQETLPQLGYRNQSPFENRNFFNRLTSKDGSAAVKRKVNAESNIKKKKGKIPDVTDEKSIATSCSEDAKLQMSEKIEEEKDSANKSGEAGPRIQQDKTLGLDEWNRQKSLNDKYFTLPNFCPNATETASNKKTDQSPTPSITFSQSSIINKIINQSTVEQSTPILIESDQSDTEETDNKTVNPPGKPSGFYKNVLVKSIGHNDTPIVRLVSRESKTLPVDTTQTHVEKITNSNNTFNTKIINNTYFLSQKIDNGGPLLSQNLVVVAKKKTKRNLKSFKIVDNRTLANEESPSVKQFKDSIQSDVSLTLNQRPFIVRRVTDQPMSSAASITPPSPSQATRTLCVTPSLTKSTVSFTVTVSPSKQQGNVDLPEMSKTTVDKPVMSTMTTIPVMPALASLSVQSTVTATPVTPTLSVPAPFPMIEIPLTPALTSTYVTPAMTVLPVIPVSSLPVITSVTSEAVAPQTKGISMPVTVTSCIGDTFLPHQVKPAVLDAKGVDMPVTVTAPRVPVAVIADSSPVITRVTSLRDVVDLVSSDEEEETDKPSVSEPMFQMIFKQMSVDFYVDYLNSRDDLLVLCIDRTVPLWTVDARYIVVTDKWISCKDYTYWATGFKGKLIRLLVEDVKEAEVRWGDTSPSLMDGKVMKKLQNGIYAQVLTQVPSTSACASLRAGGVQLLLYDTMTAELRPAVPETEGASDLRVTSE